MQMVVVYFKLLLTHFSEGSEKNHKHQSAILPNIEDERYKQPHKDFRFLYERKVPQFSYTWLL
jgi:hypothetical protein